MQDKYTTAIRGLSIAAIALSAIALLGCLLGAAILALTGSFFGGGMMDTMAHEFMYDLDYYYDPMVMGGIDAIVGFTVGIIGLVLGWEILGCAVSLIAGILGTRYAADPAKLNSVFGWGIAGAVAAFLGGRIITMVLLIIAAILAKKTHDDASKAQWQNAAAAQGYNPYGQPAYAQGGYVPVTQPAAAPAAAPTSPAAAPAAASVAGPAPQQVPVESAPQYAPQQPAQPTPYQQAYAQQPANAEPIVLDAQPVSAEPAPQPTVETVEVAEVIEVADATSENEAPKA